MSKTQDNFGHTVFVLCARIVEHPLTAVALTNDCEEREQWFSVMWEIVFSILAGGERTSIEKLDTVLRLLSKVWWSSKNSLICS